MQKSDLQKSNLPDVPGVYLFKQGRKVLYVGKATSLRDRVRSYFDDDLIATRGPRVVDMVTKADRIAFETTPTVLEALVREAALIKQYLPKANVDGKDDKTFLYAVVTQEEIPRVLAVRGKDIDFKAHISRGDTSRIKYKAIYGPFPSGAQLREGLRLIRRIFPFFDTPKPLDFARGKPAGKHQRALVEFNTQIGQYPRDFDAKQYKRTIRKVMLFLSGRGKELRVALEKEMKTAAREERFENAAEARRELFALDHIQDVSLIKDENRSEHSHSRGDTLRRIEAYDTAHLSGTNAIGVMTVVVDGTPVKKEYRTFTIKGVKKSDDIASLKEILSRRLAHSEWPFPNTIVVDGGRTQKKAAETVLKEMGIAIPVAAVVKDERHRPREVIGARSAGVSEADAVLANAEAHRFSLARHRRARSRNLRTS
ncbi:MAG: UvrB/UvrC motif-containing protein [Candidatus Pacebacteria bacterium]|nr:UvrB/UvrC motif-containing protein [Candidatus Paceibacterota bacterium]